MTNKNINYVLVDYLLKSLTDKLMGKYALSYDVALQTVLASATYSKIAETGVLQNESPLYVFSLLEEELTNA